MGLRRIVLETPELEDEIGATLTRALLVRAEQNLYGRLTLEEFFILAREVALYTQGRAGTYRNPNKVAPMAPR